MNLLLLSLSELLLVSCVHLITCPPGHVSVGAPGPPPHPQLLHRVEAPRDGGRLELHHVLRERPGLVGEQDVDLAQLLVEVGAVDHGWVLGGEVLVPDDEHGVDDPLDLQGDVEAGGDKVAEDTGYGIIVTGSGIIT